MCYIHMQLQRAGEKREAAEARARELERQVFIIYPIQFRRYVRLYPMLMFTVKLGAWLATDCFSR